MSGENSKEELIKKIKEKNKEQEHNTNNSRTSPVTCSSSKNNTSSSQSSKSSRFIEDLERKWEGDENESYQGQNERKVFNSLKKKLFNSR